MGCGTGLVKYTVFLFNLIFVLVGIAFIVVGALFTYGIGKVTDSLEELGTSLSIVPILVIVVGCIVFVISFFGCCGALRESTCMLNTYAVMLLILFLLQVSLGTYAFLTFQSTSTDIQSEISKAFRNAMQEYNNEPAVKEGIDTIQRELKCCGAENSFDWVPITITPPDSCSVQFLTKGCVSILFDTVNYYAQTAALIVLIIAGVELVAAIIAFCLASCLRNNARRSGYY